MKSYFTSVLPVKTFHISLLWIFLTGTPALHMACKAGLIEVVREMIRHRVKIGVKDKEGLSALQVC